MAIQREDMSTDEYDKLVTVYYHRTGMNMPTLIESRAIVNLGSNGELISIVWNWPNYNLVNVDPAEVKTAADINSEIVAQMQQRYDGPMPEVEYVEVQEAYLGYYEDGLGIIEPAYFAFGQVKMFGDVDLYSWDLVGPALITAQASYPWPVADPEPDPAPEEGDEQPPE